MSGQFGGRVEFFGIDLQEDVLSKARSVQKRGERFFIFLLDLYAF